LCSSFACVARTSCFWQWASSLPCFLYVGGEHNKVWFHTVGIFELVLLLGAIVLSIIARKKEKQAAAAQAADTAVDSKTEETDA